MAKAAKAPLTAGPCPCGSGLPYKSCCAPLHQGAPAPSAEALMRSRYSAYALGLDEYVLKTWAAQTRPEQLFEPGEPRPKWISLTVHESSESGDSATVTFTAKARTSRGAIVMKERSRFSRAGDTWVYVDGDQLA